MPKLPEHIEKIGKAFGLKQSDLWDCRGKWIAYHSALERIAVEQSIRFDLPTVVEARSAEKIAAICVAGHMRDKSEWSFGEAAPGNNKNAYPWAMAEKRAKDRVILKLLGLHGLVYSEEEADDFKTNTPAAANATDSMGQDDDPRTVLDGLRSSSRAKKDGDGAIVEEMERCQTHDELSEWKIANDARIKTLPRTWQNAFWGRFDAHYADLTQKEKAA